MDGLHDSLELQRAEPAEIETSPGADQPGQQLAGEDLAALRRVAQPLGHDDRRAEEVVLVTDRLAGVQPHADLERRAFSAPVVLADSLLDRHCRPESVEGGPEGDHQAVAEVLHLMAAVGRQATSSPMSSLS